MNHDVIFDLVKTYLDTVVTVYFANEYIKGHWFSIDAHKKVIGIHNSKNSRSLYIDIDCINAIEVES